jgi:hypothetical protein
MLRIYADFNNCDEQGRVRLNTVGSLRDIDVLQRDMAPGLRVIVYTPDELEVEADLEFDVIWLGTPDWATIKYLDRSEMPE